MQKRVPVSRQPLQLLLDPQQLIILLRPFRPAGRPGLDLSCAAGHRDIRDDILAGLSASMGDNRPVSRLDRKSVV